MTAGGGGDGGGGGGLGGGDGGGGGGGLREKVFIKYWVCLSYLSLAWTNITDWIKNNLTP